MQSTQKARFACDRFALGVAASRFTPQKSPKPTGAFCAVLWSEIVGRIMCKQGMLVEARYALLAWRSEMRRQRCPCKPHKLKCARARV